MVAGPPRTAAKRGGAGSIGPRRAAAASWHGHCGAVGSLIVSRLAMTRRKGTTMTAKKTTAMKTLLLAALAITVLAPTAAQSRTLSAYTTCAPDSVHAGTVCLDTYEASVWRVPDPAGTNAMLVKKIRTGRATRADLLAGGGRQLGTTTDDYAPCADNGQNCLN